MKYYFRYSLIALIFFLCTLFYFNYFKRTKGFSYIKIHSHYGYTSRWDFGPPSKSQQELLDQISGQTFTLIGSGKDCYAFVSTDEKIVVKFFKQKHMSTQYLLNYLPLPQTIQSLINENINKHRIKRNALYQSYQIAYERLSQETGVLYLHLTKTKNLKRTIHLKTPKRKNLTLKLDDVEFLVQKRSYSIFDEITNHPQQRKEIISLILTLITERHKKGIGDNDINCKKNLGFLEGEIMQIDIGEFYPAIPKAITEEELEQATFDLKHFLEKNYPELVSYLQAQIKTFTLKD